MRLTIPDCREKLAMPVVELAVWDPGSEFLSVPTGNL